jgi:hypothetical protein
VPDVGSLKDALVDACVKLTEAGVGAGQAAMATAGLVTPDQLPPGMDMPVKSLSDAGSLASQAAQIMAAVRDTVSAITDLEKQFPSSP